MNIFLIPLIAVMSPVIILGTLVFWALLTNLFGSILHFIFPPDPPYCDINPRCHIAFAWDKQGRGWIGNHCVIGVD